MFANILQLLFSLVWVAHSAVPSSATPEDWSTRIRDKVRVSWPTAKSVVVQVHQVPAGIPETAEFFVQAPEALVGLVTVEWRWVEGGAERRRFTTAFVRVRAPVVVARQAVFHGQTIDPQSLGMEERDLHAVAQQGFFLSIASLDRRKARGYIAPGAVLGVRNTTAPILVERGQWARLVQHQGPLTLSLQVEALESGSLGDWIRVTNPKSKRILRARTVGISEVELY